MTAIVGALNKRVVAIAADSAVTLGDTHKVLHSGNKIFRLSKYASIGVATYGNAALMGCPWEIIIKEYRRKLKDNKFPTFSEYVQHFIDYLVNNNFFTSDYSQRAFLRLQITNFYNINVELSKKRSGYSTDPDAALRDELQDCLDTNKRCTEFCDHFNSFTFSDFLSEYMKEIENANSEYNLTKIKANIDLFAEAFYYYLKIKINRSNDTGLVFFGYGEEDLYPSIKEVICNLGLNGKLQYFYGNNTQISNEGTFAAIIPFAQPDVTQTIIRGVNPSFYEILTRSFDDSIIMIKQEIANEIRKDSTLIGLADRIASLDTNRVTKSFMSTSRAKFLENYTNPLVNTIGSLGVEDLANMTESFVSLTSLIRRMSPKEETVGGPVDVAVITKGDGFIWMKRKHYFDSNLNSHFFDNYYND